MAQVGASLAQASNTQALQKKQFPIVQPIGTAVLQDHMGRELNLDGTARIPYRHPNYGNNYQQAQQVPLQQVNLEEFEEEQMEQGSNRGNNRFRANGHHELRRLQPVVKPAKLNIPEFNGEDADSWIQTIEQYFESA